MSRKLKIGFDFDGVIMYNPLRVIRPIMSFLKIRKVVKREQLIFFHPQTPWQKFMWWLAHQSSILPGLGVKELRQLVKSGKIEAHLITGRSSFLEKDLRRKLKMYGLHDLFDQIHISHANEQPHLFKQQKIKELKLDYFIEDNWDIVQHLRSVKLSSKILWIYNWADRKIQSNHKHPHLKQAIEAIFQFERSKT